MPYTEHERDVIRGAVHQIATELIGAAADGDLDEVIRVGSEPHLEAPQHEQLLLLQDADLARVLKQAATYLNAVLRQYEERLKGLTWTPEREQDAE